MMREGGLKQHVVCLVQDILILQKAGNETTTQPELDLGESLAFNRKFGPSSYSSLVQMSRLTSL